MSLFLELTDFANGLFIYLRIGIVFNRNETIDH